MNYEYNANGLIIKAIDKDGNTWEWDYDKNENMIHHKGPGNEFWKEYDSQNRGVKYVCENAVVVTEYAVDGAFTQTTIETKV